MGPGGPKSSVSDQSLCGVYYAIVTQNKDEELALGRIKVRFPWMPGGGEDQAHWAQLAVPMAGAEFGTWTIPEVDDTVLVAFISGDIRHPVVLGGIWNSVDKPPEVNENGKNDFRFIQSRSGHRLLFDDSDKTKTVLTDFKNEQTIGAGKFGKGGDGPNSFEVSAPQGAGDGGFGLTSANGTINLWCPNGTLTIKGSDVKITAMQAAEVKSGGEMKLQGSTAGTASGSAGAKFEGSKVKIN
jgi:phage baseplate assembly protein gpV